MATVNMLHFSQWFHVIFPAKLLGDSEPFMIYHSELPHTTKPTEQYTPDSFLKRLQSIHINYALDNHTLP